MATLEQEIARIENEIAGLKAIIRDRRPDTPEYILEEWYNLLKGLENELYELKSQR